MAQNDGRLPIGVRAWEQPADSWDGAIERYIDFIQIPTWRASAARKGGGDPRPCVPAHEAERLKRTMLRIVQQLAAKKSKTSATSRPELSHLDELRKYVGSEVRPDERCSVRVHWHFQRAFL